MIKLRLDSGQSAEEAHVTCSVVGDSRQDLPVDAGVSLDRQPSVAGERNLYRLRWGTREQFVQEVGDADAEVRLFERV